MSMQMEPLFARVEELMGEWSLEEATQLLEKAKAAGAFPNRVHHDLSVLYAQQGFFAEALSEIEAAMAADPSNRAVWHHFLAIQKNNPSQPSPRQWRAMHLAFGDTLAGREDRRYRLEPRPREPGRRLRIGYLCPDTHLATARFVWPVFECFDAARYEVFAYWCHAPDTHAAERAYPHAAHRAISGLDDDAVAGLIVDDAIDIVVDVAGHGSGNVLPAIASRPAPVRMTWLDYLATSGIAAMDYRITDAVADPPGAEEAHVERLMRLPVPQWCYRPHPSASTDAVPAPREGAGTVFGSVCVPLKLSDTAMGLWARLLVRVPGSRMRFLGVPEGRARARIVRSMAKGGVGADRIEFIGRLSQREFFDALSALDIVLDSHPFSGATSTLDALWQGVPVVTLAGPLSHGRSSASLLAALGRSDLVAVSSEGFVDIAAALAADRDRLGHERVVLRAALRASPLCDGRGFARAMEAAFENAWSAGVGRNEVTPGQRAAATWRQIQHEAAAAGAAAPRKRALGLEGWTCVTSSRYYDLDAVPLEVPDALLNDFDVLGALGASEVANGDVKSAGAGRVRGIALVAGAAEDRLYCSLFLAEGFSRCVALAGTVLLVRNEWLFGLEIPADGGDDDEPAFRLALHRLSCELRRKGARLGIAVGLAAPDRSRFLVESAEFAAMRTLERSLGLERWSQRRPAAVPLKAAFARAAWRAIIPALERRCDSAGTSAEPWPPTQPV